MEHNRNFAGKATRLQQQRVAEKGQVVTCCLRCILHAFVRPCLFHRQQLIVSFSKLVSSPEDVSLVAASGEFELWL